MSSLDKNFSQYPYPGLRAFDRQESDIFFGREQQVDKLLKVLAQGENHFLAVLGHSGNGKSSLVRAGLLASLEAGFLAEAGINWRTAEFRPEKQPYDHLAKALLQDTALPRKEYFPANTGEEKAAGFFQAILRRGSLGLHDLLREYPLPEKTNLLILVDQFEELFRYEQEQDTVAAFIQLLLESCRSHPHSRLYLVITMRSEYLGHCARFSGLPEAINEGSYLLPRLSREQLQQAVENPAKVFDGRVEPALTERILNDMAENPDLLPLMQYVLSRLWWPYARDKIAKPELCLEHYLQVGGLTGALDGHAEEAYEGLSDFQREIARVLFQSLAEPGQMGELRRSITVEEVARLAQTAWEDVTPVVERFRRRGRRFLLPRIEDTAELQPETLIEIVHESVIKYWKRLTQWTREENEAAEQYRFLEERALRFSRGEGELLGGLDLDKAIDWRRTIKPNEYWAKRYGRENGRHFTQVLTFIEQGEQARLDALAEKERRRKEELQQIRKEKELAEKGRELEIKERKSIEDRARLTREKFKMSLATLVIILLLVSIFTFSIWNQRNKAIQARAEAEQAQEEAEQQQLQRTLDLYRANITHASLLARSGNFGQAVKLIGETYPLDGKIPPDKNNSFMVSSRGLLHGYLAWRSDTTSTEYIKGVPPLHDLALSQDGKWIAASGERNTLLIFDRLTKKKITVNLNDKENSEKILRSVVFDKKNRWLAVGGSDGFIQFFSYPRTDGTSEKIQVWNKGKTKILSLAASPDARFLASGHDNGEINIWDIHGNGHDNPATPLYTLSHVPSPYMQLKFSEDSRLLAAVSEQPPGKLWALKPGSAPEFKGEFTGTYSLALEANAGRMATLWPGGVNIYLRNLNLEANPEIHSFSIPHEYPVYALSFTPDGGRLASAGREQLIHQWDVPSGKRLRTLYGHLATITAMRRFDDQLYTTGNDGSLRRWETGLNNQKLYQLNGQPWKITLCPEKNLLALGYKNGRLELRDLNQPNHLLDGKDKAHGDLINELECSPSGNYLLSSGYDYQLKLWNIQSRSLDLGYTQKVSSVASRLAIAADETFFVAAHWNGELMLHQLSDGKKLGVGRGTAEIPIYSIAFSPDPQRMLTTDHDGKIALWKLQEKNGQIKPVLEMEEEVVSNELLTGVFSPNGKLLAVSGRGGVIYLYDSNRLDVDVPAKTFVGHDSTVFRLQFTPDGGQLLSVSADTTLRAWSLAENITPDFPLFTLELPANLEEDAEYDFDYACQAGQCWLAVSLPGMNRLVMYDSFSKPSGRGYKP